jgi:leucyl aminopeptidase (aminopeptidase T)
VKNGGDDRANSRMTRSLYDSKIITPHMVANANERDLHYMVLNHVHDNKALRALATQKLVDHGGAVLIQNIPTSSYPKSAIPQLVEHIKNKKISEYRLHHTMAHEVLSSLESNIKDEQSKDAPDHEKIDNMMERHAKVLKEQFSRLSDVFRYNPNGVDNPDAQAAYEHADMHHTIMLNNKDSVRYKDHAIMADLDLTKQNTDYLMRYFKFKYD